MVVIATAGIGLLACCYFNGDVDDATGVGSSPESHPIVAQGGSPRTRNSHSLWQGERCVRRIRCLEKLPNRSHVEEFPCCTKEFMGAV